jgi:hypothetical protein
VSPRLSDHHTVKWIKSRHAEAVAAKALSHLRRTEWSNTIYDDALRHIYADFSLDEFGRIPWRELEAAMIGLEAVLPAVTMKLVRRQWQRAQAARDSKLRQQQEQLLQAQLSGSPTAAGSSSPTRGAGSSSPSGSAGSSSSSSSGGTGGGNAAGRKETHVEGGSGGGGGGGGGVGAEVLDTVSIDFETFAEVMHGFDFHRESRDGGFESLQVERRVRADVGDCVTSRFTDFLRTFATRRKIANLSRPEPVRVAQSRAAQQALYGKVASGSFAEVIRLAGARATTEELEAHAQAHPARASAGSAAAAAAAAAAAVAAAGGGGGGGVRLPAVRGAQGGAVGHVEGDDAGGGGGSGGGRGGDNDDDDPTRLPPPAFGFSDIAPAPEGEGGGGNKRRRKRLSLAVTTAVAPAPPPLPPPFSSTSSVRFDRPLQQQQQRRQAALSIARQIMGSRRS